MRLDQVSVPIEGVRSALIPQPVYRVLMNLRSFRHFERHNDRPEFDEARIEENQARTKEVVPAFITDIDRCSAAMSNPI